MTDSYIAQIVVPGKSLLLMSESPSQTRPLKTYALQSQTVPGCDLYFDIGSYTLTLRRPGQV